MGILGAKQYKAFTIVEVMIAATTLFIIVLGALSYQYHSAVQNRIARSNVTATRTAQLLLEDWKNTGGMAQYDPEFLDLGFVSSSEEDADYFIFADTLPMFINLTSEDIGLDEEAGVTLRRLNVRIGWRRDYRVEAPESDDPYLLMTTYVRTDAAGG